MTLRVDRVSAHEHSVETREVNIAIPTARDGAEVWRLIRSATELDLNSSYAYLLLCDRFGESSRILRVGSTLVGALLGFRVPKAPDTLFVWQVAVRRQHRGRGIGRTLLDHAAPRSVAHTPRFIEAHVSATNHASRALFQAFARSRNAVVSVSDSYRVDDFPDAHPAEQLLRIGPLP